jgi:phenylalanyl-tRNA synthetase alpha chain
MQEDIISLKNQAIARIGMAHSASELEEIRIDLFGKNGSLTNSIKNIKNAPIEEKKQIGLTINEVKATIENLLTERKNSFKENARDWCIFNIFN